jgi:hypothetical protein
LIVGLWGDSFVSIPKALPTVPEFLAALPADRQATVTAVHKAIRKAAPKLAPFIRTGMGPSPLIAYGSYRYRSGSGKEGEWFLVGLVPGKTAYSLHICVGGKEGYLVEQHAKELGKVKVGRTCINFKKLEDLNLAAAMALVKQGVKLGGVSAV